MRRFGFVVVSWMIAGCPDSGVETDTLTTGTGDLSTGTTGMTGTTGEASTGTTGAAPTTGGESSSTGGTGEASSTGESGTTGGVDACTPTIEPIPEAMFVSTFINTICAQKVECGCADDMCSVKFKADLEDLVLYGNSQGMVYDPECAAQTVHTYVTSRGCMNLEQANYPFCDLCPVYRGDIADGEMCSYPLEPAIYLFSEPCAGANTFCFNDVCYVPSDVELKLGEVCYSEDFDILESCEAGTVCDVFDSEVCEKELLEGDPCLGPDGVCGGDVFCGDKGVCEPYRPAGEPCSMEYDCASQYCDNFICAESVYICDVDEVGDLFVVNH